MSFTNCFINCNLCLKPICFIHLNDTWISEHASSFVMFWNFLAILCITLKGSSLKLCTLCSLPHLFWFSLSLFLSSFSSLVWFVTQWWEDYISLWIWVWKKALLSLVQPENAPPFALSQNIKKNKSIQQTNKWTYLFIIFPNFDK